MYYLPEIANLAGLGESACLAKSLRHNITLFESNLTFRFTTLTGNLLIFFYLVLLCMLPFVDH